VKGGASEKTVSLKCGLEIHQQLDTHKLFCPCPSDLTERWVGEFVRRLRPVQSELGEVDRAALLEASKKRGFRYKTPVTTCLVEADEEPPHSVNMDAVETALVFSLMVHATPVDEIHFMRKIVIDGSNTTGFQRTALIARNGWIDVDVGGEKKRITISTICLEEDAARPVEKKGDEVVYNLDRLGVPLIEIATGPDIDSPEMGKKAAETIGMLLRTTRRVKRGLGTIREDLNISIPGGARTEIKGVQELGMISSYIEEEMHRQERLLRAAEVLRDRGADVGEVVDVTEIFQNTKSKVIKRALKGGGVVLALPLYRFRGVLGIFSDGKKCLGPELAAYARTAGVGGLFHTDELPAYGITEKEVGAVEERLGLGEKDAFVLIADREDRARRGMERVIERARMALEGVPEETRDPLPEGTTRYSRPLPGKARMYPETDVPPIEVTPEMLDRLRKNMPEYPWVVEKRLVEKWGLSGELAGQIMREGVWDDFERLAGLYRNVSPPIVGTALVSHPEVGTRAVEELLAMVEKGEAAKEAIKDVLEYLSEHPGSTVEDGMRALGVGGGKVDLKSVEERIRAIVAERMDFVREKGVAAVNPLMGIAMKEFRGKVDGKRINEMLRKAVEEALRDQL